MVYSWSNLMRKQICQTDMFNVLSLCQWIKVVHVWKVDRAAWTCSQSVLHHFELFEVNDVILSHDKSFLII